MRLTSLKLLNYKRYKEFRLDFRDGLTGLIGRNGAGKSTIFDAISFALYGDIRGEKLTIRNAKASQKDAVVVELSFEVESKSYKVVRELRGKGLIAKAHLYDDKDSLLSESVKSVNSEIVKLLGMSKDAFEHTVFASQKELTALSGLKNEDRKRIIRKLLGLEKIDKIEIDIKLKLRALKSEIGAVESLLLSKEDLENYAKNLELKAKNKEQLQKEIKQEELKLAKSAEDIKSSELKLKEFVELKDSYLKLRSSLELAKNSLENSKKSYKLSVDNLNKLEQKQKQYNEGKVVIQEYNSLLKKLEFIQKQKELHIKKEALEKEQKELRQRYKDLEREKSLLSKKVEQKDKLLQKQKSINLQIKQNQDALNVIDRAEKDLYQVINQAKGLIEDTNKKVANIERIGKGSNCPTCTRPLLEEYDKVIDSLKATINRLQKEEVAKREQELKPIKEQKEKIQTLQKELEQSLQNVISDLRVILENEKSLKVKEAEFNRVKEKGLKNKSELESLKDVKYSAKEHKELLEKKASIEPKYKELISSEQLIAQIPSVEKDIKEEKKAIANYEEILKDLERLLKSHKYSKDAHKAQEDKHTLLQKAKDDITSILNSKKLEEAKITSEITNIKNILKRDKEQRDELENKIQDRDDYEKLKGYMAEFKTRINAQIAPRISQLASTMYAEITRGKYQHIEVSSDFDFFIYDEGIKYPIERFSGGEIDLANLVLRIAISKTLAELNGSTNIGFLAFDEVFGSQDQERRFEIMDAFHTIKEHYRQIFLISHESEIKEMFENVIEL